MADNVAITAGSGTGIATDEVTGTLEHVQLFKLAYSADGVRTLVPVDADGVLVNLGANNDVTVTSGTVTADAGTNLNTSALALETGGNLASITTAVQLLDDSVFAEDVAATPADKGVAVLAVRRDADTSLVDTDNDYANLQVNATGALKVEIFDGGDSHTVDGTVAATQSGTWTVQPGNTPNTTAWLASLRPAASGGNTTFHLVSAATTNATNLKSSAGQVYGWYIYNSNASARKVAFHNTAGTPTAGTGVVFSLVIPPTSAANVSFPNGLAFATGIAITTVTELTDAGTTAVAASDLIINIWYT